MFPGAIRHLPAAMLAAALLASSAISPCRTAIADPDQDQKFFDLLGQKEIPPVDNANSLITSARHTCQKLDDGMPVGDLVELIRNNGFNDNPLERLAPQDRITRTITQFINASVEAYCPYDRGKIASIAAYRSSSSPRIALASVVTPIPAGEINPTKPLPVPAQPPPPVPQEIQPVPQEPPPPPRHAPPVPKRAPPPPEEPPPPAEVPQAPPPEAAPPAPAAPGGGGNAPAPEAPGGGGNAPVPGAPGGGTGGGNTPVPQTPEAPAPPGHIRLAP